MESPLFLPLIINLGVSLWAALFLGAKRRIGVWYSFIFCITLTPLIGLVITLISPPLNTHEAYKDIKNKYITGSIVSFAFSGLVWLLVIYNVYLYNDSPDYYTSDKILPFAFVAAGLLALGMYLKNPPERFKPVGVELLPSTEKIRFEAPQIKPSVPRKKMNIKIHIPYKLIGLIIVALLVVGFVLKPSYSRFKEFSQDAHGKNEKIVCRKTGDCIVYAFYEKIIYREYSSSSDIVKREVYVGYLLNFHKLP